MLKDNDGVEACQPTKLVGDHWPDVTGTLQACTRIVTSPERMILIRVAIHAIDFWSSDWC